MGEEEEEEANENDNEAAFEDDFDDDLSFGNFITIERTINQSGSSPISLYRGNPFLVGKKHHRTGKEYKLEKMTTKREDLDEMLELFSIQVENPVTILDQENAKRFIGGQSTEKFAFFEKATSLQELKQSCQDAKVETAAAREFMQGYNAKIDKAKERVDKLSKSIEKVKGYSKTEKAINDCRIRTAWLEYYQFDDKYNAAKKKKDEVRDKLKSLQERYAKYNEPESNEDGEDLNRLQRKNRLKLKGRYTEIKNGIKEHKNLIKGKEDERGKVEKKISEAKRIIKDLEKNNKENPAEIQKIERLINSGA